MLQSLDTAATGMYAAQTRLADIANDLANVNTDGYRSQRTTFADLMYVKQRRGSNPQLALGTGVEDRQVGVSSKTGAVRNTGNPRDVAINDAGTFFKVRRPDGKIALTRAGQLSVNAQGRLQNAQGDIVLGVKKLPKGATETDVSVGDDGTVSVTKADGTSTPMGKIACVTVAHPEELTAVGDVDFETNAQSGPARTVKNPSLIAGGIEGSSVDTGDAMSEMIEVQRAYQLAGKAISTSDEMLKIANEVKR